MESNKNMEVVKLSPYATLAEINVSNMTEKKNNLTYLSWTHAFNAACSKFPGLEYDVLMFEDERCVELPYIYDKHLGYMVMTTVTLEGVTRKMWLMVSDGANKSMRNEPWTYQVKNKGKWDNEKKCYGPADPEFIEKTVQPATMFDINTTIMRCLTKNLAMHGLGINVYACEDLPLENDEVNEKEKARLEKEKAMKLEIKQKRKDIAQQLMALSECGQTKEETANSISKHLNKAKSLNECSDIELLKAFSERCAVKLLEKSKTK